VPILTLGWLANTDIQPSTSLKAVIEYAAKYVSKPEKQSTSFQQLQREIINNIPIDAPNALQKLVASTLNKLVAERDWSAQEVCHVLLNLPMTISTRTVVTLDCRPERNQQEMVTLDASDKPKVSKSKYEKYKERDPDEFENITLLEWMRRANKQGTALIRPSTPDYIVNYFPRYNANPNKGQFLDYCRCKLMLHHPFREVEELLTIDGVTYDTYTEAYDACFSKHDHSSIDDYYDDLPIVEEAANDDDDYESVAASIDRAPMVLWSIYPGCVLAMKVW
jgi:hypothetical protein